MTSETQAHEASSFSADGNQYLTFLLASETYGVDILRVQEIRGYTAATPIPNAPAWLRGVMNLRGTIVPVVDLRAKLGLTTGEYNRFTVIIVVTIGTKMMGLIVDAVSDVLSFAAKDIQPAPELGSGAEARFARGIAHVRDQLVVLLDLERVFSAAGVETPVLAAAH